MKSGNVFRLIIDDNYVDNCPIIRIDSIIFFQINMYEAMLSSGKLIFVTNNENRVSCILKISHALSPDIQSSDVFKAIETAIRCNGN